MIFLRDDRGIRRIDDAGLGLAAFHQRQRGAHVGGGGHALLDGGPKA